MRCKSTYRSLELYKAAKCRQSQRYHEKNCSGESCGHRYTEEELWAVMRHETADTVLAKKLGRSVTSIQYARKKVRTNPSILPGFDPLKDDPLRCLYQDEEQ